MEERADGYDCRLAEIGQRVGAAGRDRAGFLRGRVNVRRQRAEQDDDDGRRYDLPQCSGRGDDARGQFGRIVVPKHCGQRQQPHRHNRRAHDSGRCRKESADHDDRHGEPAGQRAEDSRHRGQQIVRYPGSFQGDPHQNEHQNREKSFNGLPGKHPLVDSVDDERNALADRLLPPVREYGRFEDGQIRVAEKGYVDPRNSAFHKRAVSCAGRVDRLVDHQSCAVEQRNYAERNHRRSADRESDRETGHDAPEQANENYDQSDFDAVEAKHWAFALIF